MRTHLDANNLHVKFRLVYRHGYSTETTLLRILNYLLAMIDWGQNALLVLLNLCVAFNTIDHTLLLNRLHSEICVGSPLICVVGPNKFLCNILCQWRLLLCVVSRRDPCSVPSCLTTPDSWRNSLKSSASITTFLPMILSSVHAYQRKVSLPFEQ